MAKYGVTNIAGGGGIGSDEVSVTKEYVLNGKTYVGSDTNDEISTGTMANNGATGNQSLNAGGSFSVKKGYHAQDFIINANGLASQTPGNAIPSHVLNGESYWTNGNKLTGTMNVQSILSFSCAPYSASQIIFTWKNPSSGPFSGVIIVGKVGGYPTHINDGTRYYKGFGNNINSSGVSNTIIGGFSSGAMYYFRAFSYCTINNEEWLSSITRITNTIINIVSQTITSSQIWSVPSNVHSVQVFLVGGGGGASQGNSIVGGAGGAGGHTTTKTVSVTPNQQIAITIGAGGAAGNHSIGKWYPGNPTSFGTLALANGGGANYPPGGSGGSGGGGAGYSYGVQNGGNGGSNGGNGGNGNERGGTGQGTTTRAFGESNGTLYSGGGGGGSRTTGAFMYGGAGGAGGGGNSGHFDKKGNGNSSGISGTPNSGGGGGGAGAYYSTSDEEYKAGSTGSGGSGICIIRYIG